MARVRCGLYTWFFPWPLRGAALALRDVPKTLTGYFPMAHVGLYVEPQKPLRGTFPRPLYMVSHRGAIGAMGDTT